MAKTVSKGVHMTKTATMTSLSGKNYYKEGFACQKLLQGGVDMATTIIRRCLYGNNYYKEGFLW